MFQTQACRRHRKLQKEASLKPTGQDSEQTLVRERVFHDGWADSIDVAQVRVNESFTGSTCPEAAWIITQLGNLKGRRVLELGTGAGEGAVYFALQGADVVATDISPGMLKVVDAVAAKHRTSVSTMVASADDLSAFADESFDIVYGANTLHHVDAPRCLDEVRRVLKPGGFGAFWDPLAHNPAINVYRRMAARVRTPDERPIRRQDIAVFRERFTEVRCRHFWLTAQIIFLKFYFIDHIHPSSERYWKLILVREKSLRPVITPLMRLDDFLLRMLPGVGWWCWNIAVVVRK